MRALRSVFNFYLDASIHVSLAIFSLVHITYITLEIVSYHHLLWFLFFGSISCYNFIKYGVEAKKYVLVAKKYHRAIQFFSIACLLLALYHAHFLNYNTYMTIAILVLLTGFYALPLLPNAKNLRSWGGLKIFIVAAVWAGATVILPVLAVNQLLSWDVWIETLQRFLLVLILLLPFEIRDLEFDSPELKTLPQRFGVEKTKTLGLFLTLFFFAVTFLKDEFVVNEILLKLVIALSLAFVLRITNQKKSKYFTAFWVESIPIFWWVLLCLNTYFY